MSRRHMKTPRPKLFLVWMALLSLAIGAGVVYLISEQEFNPDAEAQIVLTIGISVTVAAICIVSMTASWWFRH